MIHNSCVPSHCYSQTNRASPYILNSLDSLDSLGHLEHRSLPNHPQHMANCRVFGRGQTRALRPDSLECRPSDTLTMEPYPAAACIAATMVQQRMTEVDMQAQDSRRRVPMIPTLMMTKETSLDQSLSMSSQQVDIAREANLGNWNSSLCRMDRIDHIGLHQMECYTAEKPLHLLILRYLIDPLLRDLFQMQLWKSVVVCYTYWTWFFFCWARLFFFTLSIGAFLNFYEHLMNLKERINTSSF